MVDAPGCNGVLGHLINKCPAILSVGGPTLSLDGNETSGAVAIVSREHDGGGQFPAVEGERMQKSIKWLVAHG